MSGNYLNRYLMPRYVARLQTEFRLSLGDGFEGLPFCPTWY
jgi:hypothetical protein